MKVILRARRTGRTEELVRMCAEAEARGEPSYIICSGHDEAYRLVQIAKAMELNIAFPITLEEFLNYHYSGHSIKNFFIDNVDTLLQSLTPVPIRAVTMEQNEDIEH